MTEVVEVCCSENGVCMRGVCCERGVCCVRRVYSSKEGGSCRRYIECSPCPSEGDWDNSRGGTENGEGAVEGRAVPVPSVFSGLTIV